MYTFNLYEDCIFLEACIDNIDKKNLNHAIIGFNNIVSSYVEEWHKEDNQEIITFRIEIIDINNKDIRNIIWESKKGFLEACSIEKYIRHLINKETYQIWIKDYANDESICKFAD